MKILQRPDRDQLCCWNCLYILTLLSKHCSAEQPAAIYCCSCCTEFHGSRNLIPSTILHYILLRHCYSPEVPKLSSLARPLCGRQRSLTQPLPTNLEKEQTINFEKPNRVGSERNAVCKNRLGREEMDEVE